MPVLQGNTSGSIVGVPYNIPSTIKSIVLTNMTGGAITVALYIIEYGTNNKTTIAPTEIAANESYTTDVPIKMLAGYAVYIITTGSLDYYISID